MIVFDASSLVAATFWREGTPHRAFLRAFDVDIIATSPPAFGELREVLHRPKLHRLVDPDRRLAVLAIMQRGDLVRPSGSRHRLP